MGPRPREDSGRVINGPWKSSGVGQRPCPGPARRAWGRVPPPRSRGGREGTSRVAFPFWLQSVPLLVQENPGQQETVTTTEVQGELGPGPTGTVPGLCAWFRGRSRLGAFWKPVPTLLLGRSHRPGRPVLTPAPAIQPPDSSPAGHRRQEGAAKNRVFLESEGLGTGCHPETTAARHARLTCTATCILPDATPGWRRWEPSWRQDGDAPWPQSGRRGFWGLQGRPGSPRQRDPEPHASLSSMRAPGAPPLHFQAAPLQPSELQSWPPPGFRQLLTGRFTWSQ